MRLALPLFSVLILLSTFSVNAGFDHESPHEIVREVLEGSQGPRLFEVYPGGPTYFILGGASIPSHLYPAIDTEIMSLVQRGEVPPFQQGGFILSPKSTQKGVACLEMAYGELCVNGLRSLGTLVAYDWLNRTGLFPESDLSKVPQPQRRYDGSWDFQIPLNCSGAMSSLNINVQLKSEQTTGFASAPILLKESSPLLKVKVNTEDGEVEGRLVQLQGITHIVIDSQKFPGSEEAKKPTLELAQKFAQYHQGVFGVIWVESLEGGQRFRIDPVVCLTTDPPQFFHEQSCGSGAAAVGIALAEKEDVKGSYEFTFIPPSSVEIATEGNRDAQTGLFSNVLVKGSVELRGQVQK